MYARVCGATPGFDRTYPPEAEATAPLIKPSGGGLADAPTTTASGLPWFHVESAGTTWGIDWYDLEPTGTTCDLAGRPNYCPQF